MDFSGLLLVVVGLSYIGLTVYLANLVEANRTFRPAAPKLTRPGSLPPLPPISENTQAVLLRWLLYGLIDLIFLVGLMVLQLGLFSDIAAEMAEQMPDVPQFEISTTWAVVTFVLSALATVIGFRLVSSEVMRERLRKLIGERGFYNPQSAVHTTAAVLMLAVVVWTVALFVIQGGISGLAAELETTSVDGGDLVFQAVIQVVIALLGVGLAIRRSLADTLTRLGLRVPTTSDITWGIGAGILFIGITTVGSAIWQAVTSPEVLQDQIAAAESLAQSFATLPLAFLLAATAALGEEIWVRGALQPVFGILLTSVFFTVLHTQYTLTPATLLIFVVSLGVGFLRQRQSTTAAIIAHFVFNFIPLALASSLGGGS